MSPAHLPSRIRAVNQSVLFPVGDEHPARPEPGQRQQVPWLRPRFPWSRCPMQTRVED